VYTDPRFEIFLMCWRSGQRSLIHDHGGSLGGVKIVRGILTESLFERAPNGMIKALGSAEYHPGDIQIEEISLIHQVSNLQPVAHDAISLHIYVPPLTSMSIYTLYELEGTSGSPERFNFGAGI
jgi:cysteine dioxygenase